MSLLTSSDQCGRYGQLSMRWGGQDSRGVTTILGHVVQLYSGSIRIWGILDMKHKGKKTRDGRTLQGLGETLVVISKKVETCYVLNR